MKTVINFFILLMIIFCFPINSIYSQRKTFDFRTDIRHFRKIQSRVINEFRIVESDLIKDQFESNEEFANRITNLNNRIKSSSDYIFKKLGKYRTVNFIPLTLSYYDAENRRYAINVKSDTYGNVRLNEINLPTSDLTYTMDNKLKEVCSGTMSPSERRGPVGCTAYWNFAGLNVYIPIEPQKARELYNTSKIYFSIDYTLKLHKYFDLRERLNSSVPMLTAFDGMIILHLDNVKIIDVTGKVLYNCL